MSEGWWLHRFKIWCCFNLRLRTVLTGNTCTCTCTKHATVAVNKKLSFRSVRQSYQRARWLVFTPFTWTLSQACFRFWSQNVVHANIEINGHAYRTVWHSTLIHIWCYATEMCERWLFNVQEAAHSLFRFERSQESCYSKRTTKGRVEVFEVFTSF